MNENKRNEIDKWEHARGIGWTTSQLALAAKLTAGRIRQIVAAGDLEHTKIAPRLNMIPYLVGVAFLEEREVTL